MDSVDSSTEDLTADVFAHRSYVHQSLTLRNIKKDDHKSHEDEVIECKVYWYRWWMLFLFTSVSLIQSAVWLSYSAFVSETVEYYSISVGWVNFLLAVGPIAVIPLNFFVVPLCDLYGLRYPVLIATWIIFIGTSIRFFAHNRDSFWIVIVGQTLNAAAGSIFQSAPPLLSALWFPPRERTTATAISSLANYFGSALGFLFGFMVKKPSAIPKVLYIHSGSTAVFFLLMSATFLAAPPSPPSVSSTKKKLGQQPDAAQVITPRRARRILKIITLYITNPSFLILVISGGLSQGLAAAWAALFDAMLPPFHFTQDEISWLGFGATTAGVVGGVIIGGFVDRFLRWMKWVLLALFTAATISFAWFTLQVNHVIPGDYWTVLISALMAGLFVNCMGPLFYEFLVEVSYPNPEATTGGCLSTVNNTGTLIFILLASKIHPGMMNWLTTGAFVVFVISIFFVRSRQKRLDVDTGQSLNQEQPRVMQVQDEKTLLTA